MQRAQRMTGDRRATRVTGGLMAVAASASLLVVGTPSAQAADAKYYTVVAHRGDQNDAPENTVAAFQKAVAKGTDAIEMDIHYSSSGYPVVIHDTTLDRTTNCSGKVAKKSRTELRACDAGKWFGSKFKGQHVPSLPEALAVIAPARRASVILHMKVTPDSRQAERTMDTVRAYGMSSRTIVLASNTSTFSKMKAAGFKNFAYIFNSSAGWDQNYPIMIPYDTALSSSKIDRVHRRGGVVWPVENHPASLKSMLTDAKVDGILTNHLTGLLDLLGSPPETVKTSAAPKTSDGAKRVAHDEDWGDEETRPRG